MNIFRLILTFILIIFTTGIILWLTQVQAGVTSKEKDFHSFAELKLSKWYNYFKCLYTDDQLKKRIPFSVNDFWILQKNFYQKKLKMN